MDKMDAAVRAAASGSSAQQQKASLTPLGTDRSGRVVVYVDGDVAAARAAVKSAGGQVSDSDGQKLRAAVPATALEKLAGTRGITVVRRPELPVEMAVISEGAQLSGALGWHGDGKRGAGVKVGILDAGFGKLDEVQANGELPANVAVYNGQCGTEHRSSRGTSIAEVVHDMAPQSELFLACVTDSMDFDDAARWLKDQGVHVVNVSMGFPGTGRGSGLPDETQSVWSPATVVAWLRGNGIVVVAAAGNEADKHMGGTTADPENNGWMNISGASENQGFTVPKSTSVTVSLQWDAWDRTNHDFDLFVMDQLGKPTGLNDPNLGPRYSIRPQKETEGGLAPVETVTFVNNGLDAKTFWIYVQRKEGTSTGLRYDLTIYGDVSGVQYVDPAGSIAEPATSPYVIAVGAIRPANAAIGAVEGYSSRGPTIDGRTKPDVTGFTGVSTYSWPAQLGTSPAAAHVTGAAAVYKGANPSLDPSQLKGLLLDSSSRLRRDNDFGYGVLNLGSPKVPQAPGGSAFTPLPVSLRVLDTNTDVGGHRAPFEPGETFTLRIPSLPANATAVMIDMTASTAVRPVVGDVSLEVFADTPVGIPTLHGQMSRYSKAVLTATLHPQDKVVRIKNSGVAVNLIADMYGYYSDDQSASTFVPQSSPLRLSDTRTWGTSAPKLDAGETQTIKVREVPADATAVLVNVMATDPSAETHLELHGQTSLNKSTVVAYPGEETQTLTLVPIPEDRAIRIKGIAGSAHAVVDLVGWYVNGSSGARYVPLRHTQPIFDSATGTQTPKVRFGSGQVRGFQVKGTARIPDTAVAMALGTTVRRIPASETWTGTNVSLACHECGWRGHTNVSNPRGSSGSEPRAALAQRCRCADTHEWNDGGA